MDHMTQMCYFYDDKDGTGTMCYHIHVQLSFFAHVK